MFVTAFFFYKLEVLEIMNALNAVLAIPKTGKYW